MSSAAPDRTRKMALPKLLGILKDKTQGTNDLRMSVMNVLEKIGRPARKAVPILLQILATEEPEMQKYAADSLGKLGEKDALVGPALLKAARENKNWNVQYSAIWSLARLRQEPEKGVATIVQILKSRTFGNTLEEAKREMALMRCLSEYGPEAAPAIPFLVQVIKDDERNVFGLRKAALEVLIRVGPAAHEAIPGLKELKGPITTRKLDEIARQLRKD